MPDFPKVPATKFDIAVPRPIRTAPVLEPEAIKSPSVASRLPPPKASVGPVADRVKRQAEACGLPEGDPLREVTVTLAEAVDRLEILQASFGPDSGRLAADAARAELSAGMNRFVWHATAMRTAIYAGIVVAVALTSFVAGRGWPVETEVGLLPRPMAEVAHLQDWPAQWAACRKQAPSNGFDWCLLPVVTRAPRPEVASAAQAPAAGR